MSALKKSDFAAFQFEQNDIPSSASACHPLQSCLGEQGDRTMVIGPLVRLQVGHDPYDEGRGPKGTRLDTPRVLCFWSTDFCLRGSEAELGMKFVVPVRVTRTGWIVGRPVWMASSVLRAMPAKLRRLGTQSPPATLEV